ncbi:imidazole glycerol phosphate synthase subunit HisH [Devosia algicola]|uniref:Imidazole glycerol phosphate synthase subunit HisH n=1 Tax=Devosia algicola TaxID=3026418 RepID=A0ABY7YM95_9HYPH|nr:imidazole glycerol phosphate synthase subunit HisH [Devosia algicola]WDR02344.1 imidazole glycerol phosphate synthase subunit HisH [Devosia algicola]
MEDSEAIAVVDYGAGNIGSVLNMIRKAGGRGFAASRSEDLAASSKIILPGVGSFDNAMSRLSALRFVEPLKDHARAGRPLFGICLGMQLLSDASEEGGLEGLGLIPGEVRRFDFDGESIGLKVPHMGWNGVTPAKEHLLCRGLESDARFYFVHSYFYDTQNPADALFYTEYGQRFASGVHRGNVMGVQFHPEKSHRFGMQLLKNFIEL